MKKTFYYTILMLSITSGTLQAQFVTTGTPTSNAVYTNGAVGIGVTTAPTSPIKAYVNGMTWVSSQDVTGAALPLWVEGNNTGTYGTTTEGRLIRIKNLVTGGFYDIGINQNSGFFISKYSDNHPNSNPSFFISSAGNIGINTTVTGDRLVVNGNITASGIVKAAGFMLPGATASAGKVLTSSDGNGTFSWSTAPVSSQWVTSASDISYSTGNVGIGTSSAPTAKLEVVGTIKATGFILPGATAGKVLTALDANGTFSWSNAPSSQWAISGNNISYTVTNGNVGIGTTVAPTQKLEVVGTIKSTGFIFSTTDAVAGKVLTAIDGTGAVSWQTVPSASSQWLTSGNNISYTVTNGNVGVGTTVAPTQKLEVVGTVKATGFVLPGATAGKVLTSSDANGTFLWSNAPVSSQWVTSASDISYPTGNVGIGTTIAPTAKLEVAGTIKATGFILPGATAGMVLTALDANGTFSWSNATAASQWTTIPNAAGANNISYVASTCNGGSSYSCNNVGIGFAPGVSPTQRLHLGSGNLKLPYGYYDNDGYLIFGGDVQNGESGMRISSRQDGSLNTGGSIISVKSNDNTYYGGLSINVDNISGGTERMRILPNGNVGIGTVGIIPAAKLHVVGDAIIDGIIHTKELRACIAPGTICPPDFVFENDYKLMDLKTLQKFLDKNKHLPDVPSANEMLSNGIGMVEMNMILLRKVEELTLYVLELKSDLDKVHANK